MPACTSCNGRAQLECDGIVIVVWVFLLVLIVVTIFAGVKTVPQGQVWTVERFGAYTRTLRRD